MNVFAINDAGLDDSNEIWSWYGDADMAFQADGVIALGLMATGSVDVVWQADLSPKLYGEGAAELEWIARGEALQWHYHYAEGSADLQLTAIAERHGVPVLPSEFILAPPVRSLSLGAEHRAFIVPAERRA